MRIHEAHLQVGEKGSYIFALRCSVLQHVAECCRVLQCVAVCCSVLVHLVASSFSYEKKPHIQSRICRARLWKHRAHLAICKTHFWICKARLQRYGTHLRVYRAHLRMYRAHLQMYRAHLPRYGLICGCMFC